MSRKANPKTVGVFVVGAVVLASTAVVMFGSGKLFAKTYPFMIFFEGAVNGLDPGAPVMYRGVDVGVVREVNISISTQDFSDIRMPVVIEVNERKINRRTPNDVRLDDEAYLDTIVDAGFRASLATQSLVTGKKYVALDVISDAPPPPEYPESPYYVIPTYRTGLEELENEIKAFFDKLTDIDPAELLDNMNHVVAGLDTVVNTTIPELLGDLPATVANLNKTMDAIESIAMGLDSAIGPMREQLVRTADGVAGTMEALEATLESMRALTEPESPVIVQLRETLANLSQAGASVSRFVDFLERDPSSLIRGKSSKAGN